MYVLGTYNDEALRVCTYEDDTFWFSEVLLVNRKFEYRTIKSDTEEETKKKKKKTKQIFYVHPKHVCAIPNYHPGELVTSLANSSLGETSLKLADIRTEKDSEGSTVHYKYKLNIEDAEEPIQASGKGTRASKRKKTEITPVVTAENQKRTEWQLWCDVLPSFVPGDIVLATHVTWEGSYAGWVEKIVQDPYFAESEGSFVVVHIPFEQLNERGILTFEVTTLLISVAVAHVCLLKVI